MDGRLEIILFIQNAGARPVMDVPREVIPSHARASRPLSWDPRPCLAAAPDWFSEIPTGTFRSVNVGWDAGACGVRTDGNVVCWSCPHR
jgi:hypothetical protein